ncbi:MAG: hypothetical protein GX322_08260 [Firmicutes bacterium]|nr:hypothetical protein [Bacillota bacterium]
MSGVTFSGVIASYLRPFLACFFTGLAIKIMDDYLDTAFESTLGVTWAIQLKEAALPYALLFFSLGCLAEQQWSITLFWASYAVGMRGDLRRPLALGLTGWQETFALGVILSLVWDCQNVFTSWAAIFSLQGIDDLVDRKIDKLVGSDNWALRWGVVETSMMVIIVLTLLAYLDIAKLILVFLSSFLVIATQDWGTAKGGNSLDTDCHIGPS